MTTTCLAAAGSRTKSAVAVASSRTVVVFWIERKPARLAVTRYSPGGRTTATLRRIVRAQRGNFQTTGMVDPRGNDVIVAAGLERAWEGRRADIGAKIEAMENYNRNFAKDVPNLNLQFTTRLHPW